jgi:hypothetical protein
MRTKTSASRQRCRSNPARVFNMSCKVINFYTNETISTHESKEAANQWLDERGYELRFLLYYLLKDSSQTHKPQILQIVEEKK